MSKMNSQNFEDYLRSLINDSSEATENLRWEEVLHVIRQNAGTVDMISMHTICPLLIEALRTNSCGDRDIAARIVVTYSRYLRATRQHFGLDGRRCGNLVLRKLNFVPQKYPSWVFKHIHCEAVCAFSRVSEVHRWAFSALYIGEWKFLSVLVQYGFWSGEIRNHKSRHFSMADDAFFSEFLEFCFCFMKIRSDFENRVKRIWRSLRRSGGEMSTGNRRGFSRIPLILRTLIASVALRPRRQSTYAYLQCLRICFSAAPDPLVSSCEIEEFFRFVRKETRGHRLHDCVEQFVSVFGRNSYGPRSLIHLSRCTIRQILVKNKSASLPELVGTLDIPDNLKDLLLGAPERSLW